MKYFKNISSTSADFYVYGDIVDEKMPDWWTGEISSTEVDTNTMKEELDELQNRGIRDFNIYINSAGGSVFASSTMVSLLKRFKQNTGAKIHGFIDGLCASASTYLLMVADDINVYQNSIMMIHKPMTLSWGNANDLQKDIDTLNTIENDMMIPMYMNKCKVKEEKLKNLINDETWFSGNQNDEMFIGNFFDINYLDEAKEVSASINKNLFKNYKHIPDTLKEELKNAQKNENTVQNSEEEPKQQEFVKEENPKQEEVVEEAQKIDYSSFEETISSLKKEVNKDE